MAHGNDAQLLQVGFGQLRQAKLVKALRLKVVGVLGKADVSQPAGDVEGHGVLS